MTTAEFDPVRFKLAQRANWDALSAGWSACQDEFERGAAVVTRRLAELGGVRPGQSVLDVGTGVGEPALTVAAVTGAAGRVVGVDLAPGMIDAARRRAAGRAGVEFAVGDVESLEFPDGSFDVVLSRWGLMFAVDHVRAFRHLRRVLRPGGVLAAAVWVAAGADVPMMSLPFRVLSARLGLPPGPGGTPGPFSMGRPDVLAAELTAAGFTDVTIVPVTVPFVLDSVERYVAFARASTPPALKDLLRERYGSADDPDSWAAVAEAARRHRTRDGIALPSEALLIRAVAPNG